MRSSRRSGIAASREREQHDEKSNAPVTDPEFLALLVEDEADAGDLLDCGPCDSDPEFAAAWDDAAEQGIDLLEDEARRRAMAHSDLLLIFLLRNRRPGVYRPPRAVQLGGLPDAVPIPLAVTGRVTIYLPDNQRDVAKADDQCSIQGGTPGPDTSTASNPLAR